MNPVALALLAGKSAKEDLATLLLAEAQAIAALAAGTATPQDLVWLRRMVATAREMAVAGIGPEVLPACDAAHQALNGVTAQPAGMHLVDVGPLADLHRWHQAQREQGSAADYVRALDAARCRGRAQAWPFV